MDVLLEKFKEKNAAVGRAAAETLSEMHKYCWALLDIAENLAGARLRPLSPLPVAVVICPTCSCTFAGANGKPTNTYPRDELVSSYGLPRFHLINLFAFCRCSWPHKPQSQGGGSSVAPG